MQLWVSKASGSRNSTGVDAWSGWAEIVSGIAIGVGDGGKSWNVWSYASNH